MFASMDKVRGAASTLGSVSVQSIGERTRQQYMIRLRDDGTDTKFSSTSAERIRKALEGAFGVGRVVVMKTDFVGARFSKDLADNAWKMTLFTVLAILIYATVRFKIQYAMGAVLAILHDALIMISIHRVDPYRVQHFNPRGDPYDPRLLHQRYDSHIRPDSRG